MKITFCAYDGKNIINGINAWHLRILPGLVLLGYEIDVIFIAWADEKDCTIIPHLKTAGIKCHIIPKPHFSVDIIFWILNYINTNQPDVWVSNQMPQGIFANKWLKQANIPSICVLHNDDDEYNAILKEFILKKSPYKPDYTIAVSENLYQKAISNKNNENVLKIPYGAPIPANKTTFNLEEFRIVYVGRIVCEQKNIDNIAKAFCEIATKITNTKCLIFGSGPDLDLVKHILNEYGNPDNVLLKGNVASSELQKELLNAHAFILMSDFEGIPVAMMEAMACGLVPLCKKINSGIPELLKNNITGYYVENNNELLDKVKFLKENQFKWEELSNNAKNLIVDNFSSTQNLKEWDRLLKRIKPAKKMELIKVPKKIYLPKKNINLVEDIRKVDLFKKVSNKYFNLFKNGK